MRKKLLLKVFTLSICLSIITYTGISKGKTPKVPLRVIFETDMGNDVDDVLALDMLYKYADQGKIKLLGISSNKDSRYSTEFIDILNTWFGYPQLPVGHVVHGVNCETDAINYAQKVCEMKTEDNHFLFRRSKNSYERNLESTELYRCLLSQQPDKSVCIISVGFLTNLAKLLSTPADKYSSLTGKELIAKKVKSLVLMGGDFRKENKLKEYNIYKDCTASQKIFSEWPTSIVASPFDIGISILYPAAVIQNDSIWKVPNPVVEAYKAYLPMPYDRPTWDLTAVLYAIEPNVGYFNCSQKGFIKVDEKGFTTFTPGQNGKHRYLSVTSMQSQKIKERLIYLTTNNFHKNTK